MSLLQLGESFKILTVDNDSSFFAAFINFNKFQYTHRKQKDEENRQYKETVSFENERKVV